MIEFLAQPAVVPFGLACFIAGSVITRIVADLFGPRR